MLFPPFFHHLYKLFRQDVDFISIGNCIKGDNTLNFKISSENPI
jgi:hypothetical protein